ncbi:MAG: acyl-CoA dehydrogenase [Rhodospirillaceae bacterium]|jgi:alkylation response protein AidB-like acyl-CoA dehydrogenase|nr:acyl-CoA dehydrogenase [Rhodospirillaceae bacterium]
MNPVTAISRAIFKEEHRIYRESVRRYLEREIVPHYEKWEREGEVPRSFWHDAGGAGLLCPMVPEEYGGPGGDYLFNAVILEEFVRIGATGLLGLSVHNDIVVPYLVDYGSEEQKAHWLPKMVSGEAVAAIGMTEPSGGTDIQAIRTTARRDGNEYVIDGQKTFISNGHTADFVLLAAKTDPSQKAKGISLLIVESDRQGYARGRQLEKVGQHAADTAELFFESLRIPITNCIGEEGKGFAYMMEKLPQERLAIAVVAAAQAETALQWTIDYVKERQAFGRAVFEFQNTRFKLAEMAADTTLGRLFLDTCMEAHLTGDLDVPTAAMAKFWATDMACRVIDECVQLHGGYGYMREFPIARAWVDARVQRIYGGTNEIMKELVARSL